MLDARKNWIRPKNDIVKDRPMRMLFRRSFSFDEMPETAQLMVSADSRYKLYANGQLVEAGPCKGDSEVWFYDTLELASYLRTGKNVIAVEVLAFPNEHGNGSFSIFRTGHPGLFVSGKAESRHIAIDLSADEQWRGCVDPGFSIIKESDLFAPLQMLEERKAHPELIHWKLADYDDSSWENVVYDTQLSAEFSPGNLSERKIPFLYRENKHFIDVRMVQTEKEMHELDAFLEGNHPVTVEKNQKLILELNAGEEETGYLRLNIAGGKGSVVKLLTSEGYVQEGFQGDLKVPFKKDRLDMENGYLYGFTDTYYPAGNGTHDRPEEYTPFWFRTFRFVRLEVETKEEPMTLLSFDYDETGYPLEVKTTAAADDPDFEAIWDISERSLRRCMHETYEDCPFYEQLQYVMDSRTQILYTYAVSGDDRLARKCIDDFRRSQRSDGLTNSSHPNYESNVIPGFSIYYIFMVYDHMMYFGDKELLREHLPHIDRVLGFFHKHLTEQGYVDKVGGLNGRARFWSFIDWAAEWKQTSGIPPATLQGPITMESLIYIYGLKAAAEIASYLGFTDLADSFCLEAEKVQDAVLKFMMGKKGMLTDGPGVEDYSQHVQVFAVLTGTISREEGRKALLETIEKKEEYPQCSVAMAFYLFRALEETGLYEYTREYWGIWRRMLARHSTTCIEDEIQERSDCHAWGALILYELPTVILGVRPGGPGYQSVMIHPQPGYLKEAEGDVITPMGMVHVHWIKDEDEKLQLEYDAPEDVTVIVKE
ncbi:MAG: hypothetical protein HFH15_07320 [Ruminococcus sp.]|nr:hypothetical protein [Ruminococcus sp.]